MAIIRPFSAVRPNPDVASAVAAVPYDVVSTAEARTLVSGNPLSFLRVSRPEVDLSSDVHSNDDVVYRRATENFNELKRTVPFVVEERPSLYLYRLRSSDHEQTGVAGCFSLDEYDRNVIKRHEQTRRDKEDDRTRHLLAVGAQTGIAFLTYRFFEPVGTIVRRVVESCSLYDFVASDGVQHTLWRLDPEDTTAMVNAFVSIPAIYIADGHHRVASAARARDRLGLMDSGDTLEERNFFVGTAFPDVETRILPYNRVVTDLGDLTPANFLEAVHHRFTKIACVGPTSLREHFSMYLKGEWHSFDLRQVKDRFDGTSPRNNLDVAILQTQLLSPILGLTDVRSDPRISFVGGIHGTKVLERLVDEGEAVVAFSLAPVTTTELMEVSDAAEMMPPKSTWFEPKLRDGLLIHSISDRTFSVSESS